MLVGALLTGVHGCAGRPFPIRCPWMTAVHHHGHYVRVRSFRMAEDGEIEDFIIAGAWLFTWLVRWTIIFLVMVAISKMADDPRGSPSESPSDGQELRI